MASIPNPTTDLDWSGYVGSIQEIFAENARKHPDRTCVIETATSSTPQRHFTYKQIFEASNTLAHYLTDAGITNGDVVMIWAHRSVDLVVGIMGILASAATMSVLDPAYPPARQQIYLEVAQPRALIQIARATDEAGPLAPNVRRYVDDELELKAEVPSLRINDDGMLDGGKVDGKDVFGAVRSKASAPPNTLVGPDSNPTLSFTSGSEGRPKGVLGRHFSLAYYFSWMAEKFGLSSESKFTLLSGIAHDPVQRDIFTPLFLGAQLLVPSREDIQHERLAEWMRDHKPTVTHLTPAMGQILVGGATAEFSCLDRAFFVGDVLTKRDCKSLRDLAVNVNIVNMYGTTETQRAVSYYEIPSRARDPEILETMKDTVPAGRGMKNVQLLVVKREDRNKICDVGEVGEIYVRAAGLSSGYMGDPALNEQKFLSNWFTDNKRWQEADQRQQKNETWRKYYEGPRDRLYRTGDLGKYTESGDVECTGRADDQVKIRGFRIELNDIDSNLSQSSLIRDCKTLVRRDRNEEPRLVSYIVPEAKEWSQWIQGQNMKDIEDEGTLMGSTKVYLRRFARLRGEIREHLKGRLPEYAVPSVEDFIVLDKLPLNPNGKVDKPNLPFPDITERAVEASDEDLKRWDSLSSTQQKVAKEWANLIFGLNAKTVAPENKFFDLGGHSLLAQHMLLNISRNFGANVSITALYSNPTLAGFSAQVDKALSHTNGINGDHTSSEPDESEYGKSFDTLVKHLPESFPTATTLNPTSSDPITILLTGATGYLGAYIIRDILSRPNINLIAHVRGVKDPRSGLNRLQRSLEVYGLWDPAWSANARLSCAVGDLAQPNLGIDAQTWSHLAQTVDIIIHNGATVNWLLPYSSLLPPNVQSTLSTLNLTASSKPKRLVFVSSTSVLDSPHYISTSSPPQATQPPVPESDDLSGSRTGLGTGYGQSKWVSEQLFMAASSRGLSASIVRPGYILGESKTGIVNTDDFLIRMLKGCVQLRSRPEITNSVNAVPVDTVARVVVASALYPSNHSSPASEDKVPIVHQVNGHPRLSLATFLSLLSKHGYSCPSVPYTVWKKSLEDYVSAGAREKDSEQHALMPLFHFCVNDLPATTRAPELDDSGARSVLRKDGWVGGDTGGEKDGEVGYGVKEEDVSRYLKYLTLTGFLPSPLASKPGEQQAVPLPEIEVSAAQLGGMGGMGGRGGGGGVAK